MRLAGYIEGQPMKIDENTFLVTGGSSGLGKACLERICSLGGNVINFDLQESEDFSNLPTVLFCRTNITDPESIESGLHVGLARFGSIHGIINCAGVGTITKTFSRKRFGALQAFEDTIRINLIGAFNVVSICGAAMKDNSPTEEGERGIIINTASVAAFDGQVGQAAYSASKGGVASMTLPLARELSAYGIRVMTIAPGVIETPMSSRIPKAAKESLEASVPFPKRMGKSQEFASLVTEIIQNQYLNGEVIRLDGGIRMQ